MMLSNGAAWCGQGSDRWYLISFMVVFFNIHGFLLSFLFRYLILFYVSLLETSNGCEREEK